MGRGGGAVVVFSSRGLGWPDAQDLGALLSGPEPGSWLAGEPQAGCCVANVSPKRLCRAVGYSQLKSMMCCLSEDLGAISSLAETKGCC